MRRNLLGNRRGAQAVEFALCLPILMMIVAGTVDYGWYFQQRMVLTTATQQAAKAAANSDTPQTEATAVGNLVWFKAGMESYPTFVATTYEPSAGVDGNGNALATSGADEVVEVVGTMPYQCLICFSNIGPSTTNDMSHTAVEYWNNQATSI